MSMSIASMKCVLAATLTILDSIQRQVILMTGGGSITSNLSPLVFFIHKRKLQKNMWTQCLDLWKKITALLWQADFVCSNQLFCKLGSDRSEPIYLKYMYDDHIPLPLQICVVDSKIPHTEKH